MLTVNTFFHYSDSSLVSVACDQGSFTWTKHSIYGTCSPFRSHGSLSGFSQTRRCSPQDTRLPLSSHSKSTLYDGEKLQSQVLIHHQETYFSSTLQGKIFTYGISQRDYCYLRHLPGRQAFRVNTVKVEKNIGGGWGGGWYLGFRRLKRSKKKKQKKSEMLKF